jgi:hypothetical protein
MVLKRWFILLMLAVAPVVLRAQSVEGLEDWVEETGDTWAAGEMSDQWQQLLAQPVNLNDSAAVADLFLLSPFQRQALRNYIVLHGQLLSHAELLFVPGFDSAMVALLQPVTVTTPYTPSRRLRLADGRHSLLGAVGGTVERAAGYSNGHYEGDGLRALMCYNYNLQDKVEVRLVADKDADEAWGHGNFVGYHLMVNDVGRLERLIVGRYNLQFGQGLTLWTGLRPFNLLGGAPLRYGSGVRPAVTFYEEGYQEGVAARIRLSRALRLSTFGSRTEGEWLGGGHVEWRRGGLAVGLTALATLLDSAAVPVERLYTEHAFRGSRLFNGGLDLMWQWRRMTLYGEGAVDGDGHLAAIGGVVVRADHRHRVGLTARWYDPDYHNLHAQGYAIGSTQGEHGVSLDAESRLPLNLVVLASVDLHRFPSLRYADYSPSTGEWLRLQLSRQWAGGITSTLRYAYRRKERNIPNIDSTFYLGENTVRQQWQCEVKAVRGPWTLTGRGVYALYDSEAATRQGGGLVSLAARYSLRHLQASAALAWFDVDGYYARIYISESNLQYAWNMPALYGRGWRGHAVLRYSVNERLQMAAKYALTWMPGEDSIGSGDSQTDGPCRQTWMLQLRWRF